MERAIPKEFRYHRVGTIERLPDGSYAAELEWRLGKGFQPFMVARCNAQGQYLGVIPNHMAVNEAREKIRAAHTGALWAHGTSAPGTTGPRFAWLHTAAAWLLPSMQPRILDIIGRDDGHYDVTLERPRFVGAPYARRAIVDKNGAPVA